MFNTLPRTTAGGVSLKKAMDWFVDSVLRDVEVPVTGAQGVEIIKILDAVYASGGF